MIEMLRASSPEAAISAILSLTTLSMGRGGKIRSAADRYRDAANSAAVVIEALVDENFNVAENIIITGISQAICFPSFAFYFYPDT